MQRTLVLIKPHGLERPGLEAEILGRLTKPGFQIVGLKLVQADRALAEAHYAEHVGKFFFNSIVEEISASPLIALVLEGPEPYRDKPGTIEKIRNIVGDSHPSAAAPGTIRGDFAIGEGLNLVHASANSTEAAREILLWFGGGSEIYPYKRAIQDHLVRPA